MLVNLLIAYKQSGPSSAAVKAGNNCLEKNIFAGRRDGSEEIGTRRLACGGNVQAPNVDPAYEGADSSGGCTASPRGNLGGVALVSALAIAALLHRRRRTRRRLPG
jgi:hypothetical protein